MSAPDTKTKKPPKEAPEAAPTEEKFFDAAFSIEAMQSEPYENGFTWRTVLGAFFIALVMLPGVIFMGLMIGQDLGTAADWVTIILFVELARRSFITLRKQELYILKYTVSQLSHIGGGMALGGGMFAHMIWQRYLRHSEAFQSFGIAHQVPDWFSPYGDAAFQSGFLDPVWLPVVGVMLASMILSKLTQLSLGYMAYKVASDVEKLPFPLAPVQAEGAIALAESSQDKRKKGYRQYCFSIGVMLGAVFSLFYMAVPTLSQAFLGTPIQILPIPFWDLTTSFETILPAGTIGLSLNLALLFVGFVLPWRVVVGMVVTSVAVNFVVNPFILHPLGFLTHWAPGKDAIETNVANSLDFYLSLGIGTALAIAVFGLWGILKASLGFRQKAVGSDKQIEFRKFVERDVERGDPPLWVPLVVWVAASLGYIVLCHFLINTGVPPGEQFSIWWLVAFAFVWTPVNTYINARMSGIAGQQAGIPFVAEGAIFLSGFRHVSIWFAPLPLQNFGNMADLLRETQLTRTRFTSILKAEVLVFPLMIVASFIFWTYISSLGPIPSENYPYVQKFWPQFAQMRALWASSMQEGGMLFDSIKPLVIGGGLVATLALFGLFGIAGISAQYIYGGLGALTAFPHIVLLTFIGAVLGRFVLAPMFGREKWTNYAPILAVGFFAGLGLVGMLAIAINFLWVSVGTSY
jgi:hypothetical protein